jgi:uncharacterized cupredoxin-like copper-binding protein
LAGALALLGCSSTSTGGGTPPPVATDAAAPAATQVNVNETEYKLDPSTIMLNGPGNYTFNANNMGTMQHSLAIEGNGVAAALANPLSPGQQGSFTVMLQVGTYTIFCPIDGHRQLGMVGTVMVMPSST